VWSILLRLRLCVEYFTAFEVMRGVFYCVLGYVWSILLRLRLRVEFFIAFEVMCQVFYCF